MPATISTQAPIDDHRPRTPVLVAGVPVAPSVQTVLGTLHSQQPMTSADIQATTGLLRRTVYAALRTLRGLGVLMERPSLRDMRQSYVWLNQPAVDAARTVPAERHGMQASDAAADWVQVR